MPLEDYKLLMTTTGCCPFQARPCAIAELPDDISAAFPCLSKVIQGCPYGPGQKVLAFNLEGRSVLVYPMKIVISGVEEEAEARRLLDWLRDAINTAV